MPAYSPDAIVNGLVIAVIIVLVLAGLYLYQQNRKPAAALDGSRFAALIERR